MVLVDFLVESEAHVAQMVQLGSIIGRSISVKGLVEHGVFLVMFDDELVE